MSSSLWVCGSPSPKPCQHLLAVLISHFANSRGLQPSPGQSTTPARAQSPKQPHCLLCSFAGPRILNSWSFWAKCLGYSCPHVAVQHGERWVPGSQDTAGTRLTGPGSCRKDLLAKGRLHPERPGEGSCGLPALPVMCGQIRLAQSRNQSPKRAKNTPESG